MCSDGLHGGWGGHLGGRRGAGRALGADESAVPEDGVNNREGGRGGRERNASYHHMRMMQKN